MNAGQIIVIGLSLSLALWFAGGIWYNRRRGQRLWRWLEPGLALFGGRVGKPWFSSSGAGLRVAAENPRPPFRRVELFIRLQSRENPPLWLFEWVQGRRDQIALRAWLRSPGRSEVEIVSAGSALERDLAARSGQAWQRRTGSPHWVITWRGNLAEEQLVALQTFVSVYEHQLQRFSWRPSEPHLFLQMTLDALTEGSSAELLGRVRAAVTT